ncbi:hypothetical protein ACIBF1_32800 [Spirillospora sp. NPDC050679]
MGWIFGAALFVIGIFLIVANKRVSKLAAKARSDQFAGGLQETERPFFRVVMIIVGIGWMGLGVAKVSDFF